MDLVLDVNLDGETRRVEIGLALTDSQDIARAVDLCGADALVSLAKGDWVLSAAKAIIYVNLIGALDGWDNPPFTFEQVDLDWGDLSDFMVELDPEMELALAAASGLEET